MALNGAQWHTRRKRKLFVHLCHFLFCLVLCGYCHFSRQVLITIQKNYPAKSCKVVEHVERPGLQNKDGLAAFNYEAQLSANNTPCLIIVQMLLYHTIQTLRTNCAFLKLYLVNRHNL